MARYSAGTLDAAYVEERVSVARAMVRYAAINRRDLRPVIDAAPPAELRELCDEGGMEIGGVRKALVILEGVGE